MMLTNIITARYGKVENLYSRLPGITHTPMIRKSRLPEMKPYSEVITIYYSQLSEHVAFVLSNLDNRGCTVNSVP